MSNREHPRLFPDGVAYREAAYDADDAWLAAAAATIVLPPSLHGAVDKRRREFIAGRACARDAIRIIAPELAEQAVSIGNNREPLWPRGLVGALTHSHGFVAAAVGRAADYRGLGLDSERIIEAELAASVAEMVATPEELAAIERATRLPTAVALTLLFSAKESIFKCLYPLVGRYFDFLDAELQAADVPSSTFAATLRVDLSPELRRGLPLPGRFALRDDRVITAMHLAAAVR